MEGEIDKSFCGIREKDRIFGNKEASFKIITKKNCTKFLLCSDLKSLCLLYPPKLIQVQECKTAVEIIKNINIPFNSTHSYYLLGLFKIEN